MAKTKKSPKPSAKKYSGYKIAGDKLDRTKKVCPKCGAGTFMANHKNRNTCGSCHYTEFTN